MSEPLLSYPHFPMAYLRSVAWNKKLDIGHFNLWQCMVSESTCKISRKAVAVHSRLPWLINKGF